MTTKTITSSPVTRTPADEFYLALCDEAPRQMADAGVHVGYLRDLYPVMTKAAEAHARAVVTHASGWLRANLVLASDGRHYLLTSRARTYLRAQEKLIKAALRSKGFTKGYIYTRPLNSDVRARMETMLLMQYLFEDVNDYSLVASSYAAMVFVGPMHDNTTMGSLLIPTFRPIGEQIWRHVAA